MQLQQKSTHSQNSTTRRLLQLLALLCLGWTSLAAQPKQDKDLAFGGYVKNLQSIIFQDEGTPLMDILFHHRLNISWDIDSSWSAHAGMRNRVFSGDQVRQIPGYGAIIDGDANDWIELSLWGKTESNVLFHSYFDRAYIQFAGNNWEIRAGRQRINWGINNFWNPNDLFNAFSFVDFDYEERPGSDAVRIRRYLGVSSSIEIAVKGSDSIEDLVGGARYTFNKGTYDLQLLTAWYREFLAVGGGWAGNLGNAGFKGEFTGFLPTEEGDYSLSAATQIDYVFSNGLYGTAGLLFNSLGATRGSLASLFSFELDARNLYPFKYASLFSASGSLSPLIQTSLTAIYSPVAAHPLFLSPSFSYSIAENWDINLVSQIVFSKVEDTYDSPVQAFFLRLKYSY